MFRFRCEQLNSAVAEIQIMLNRSSRSPEIFNEEFFQYLFGLVTQKNSKNLEIPFLNINPICYTFSFRV